MVQITVIITVFSSLTVHVITDRIYYAQLPPSLNKCYSDRATNPLTSYQTAEEIATSCLQTYLWNNVGLPCTQQISPAIMSYIGHLITPLFERRQKRQTGRLRVRREYRMLTDTERNAYHRAINSLKQDTSVFPNRYDAIALFHQGIVGTTAHGGVAFLGWHRIYLLIYENALREKDPTVTIPYWDSSLDEEMTDPRTSIIWSPDFLGEGDEIVETGPFANWITPDGPLVRNIGDGGRLITRSSVQRIYRMSSNGEMAQPLESIHDLVHVWVGGTMLRVNSAAMDPVFYMHHAYIDYIWWEFQNRIGEPAAWEYPNTNQFGHRPDDPMRNLEWNNTVLRNREGYERRFARNFFTYDPPPTCSWWAPSCRSPYLQCAWWQWPPRCISRSAPARVMEQVQTSAVFSTNINPEVKVSVLRSPPQFSGRGTISSSATFAADMSVSNLPHTTFSSNFTNALDNLRSGTSVTVSIFNSTIRGDTSGFFVSGNMHSGRTSMRALDSTNNTNMTMSSRPGISPTFTPAKVIIDPFKEACFSRSVQNLYKMNCQRHTDLWGYLPIKVTSARIPNIVYDSHRVENGKIDKRYDIYSSKYWNKLNRHISPDDVNTYETCQNDKSGLFKVTITSYGLNYDGIYKEHVFLDNRHAVHSSMGYIAVKRAYHGSSTKVYLTAFDQCGRSCRPYCLQKGSHPAVYRRCSGVIRIGPRGQRKIIGKTYEEAVLMRWTFGRGGAPTERDFKVYVTFYCDHKPKWWERLYGFGYHVHR